jgi:hypothetical protein
VGDFTRIAALSDRQLATLIGVVLLAMAAWPLLAIDVPPYQDLPDHLATVCVLLNPERYPEYVSNGWLKANSLLVWACYAMAKHIGVIGAGRVFCISVLAANAFVLPHFVLEFTDRRRLVVSSLVMAPMVHNWWILMGMLNFALAFPLALVVVGLMARQSARPTWGRGLAVAVCAGLLWFTHAVVLACVGLLAVIEAVRLERAAGRPRRPSGALALLAPLVPVALLLVGTIVRHARETTVGPEFGRVHPVSFQDNLSVVYDLWAHWSFGTSPRSAASLATAVVLAFWAARRWWVPVPMFSAWAFVALFSIDWFFPYMWPGFGFVDERALPFLWAWALVRVPPVVSRPVGGLLAVSSLAWAAGIAADLFLAKRDLDDFTAAASEVPAGARLLTLNFAPRVSSTNTWSLLHASGMYTVLRGAKPQDLWADSPSAPLRHAHRPAFVEDPLSIREFVAAAATPAAYCATLAETAVPPFDCAARWGAVWADFWTSARERYDHVLLWGAPPEVLRMVPMEYAPRFARGRLELRARGPRS